MTDNGRRSRTPPGAATIFDPYMLMNGPNKKISNRLALYFAAAFLSGQELPAQQPAERAVPLAGIHIRDPYILPVAGDSTYYLFGTNQADVSYRSKGFYCYASRDLKEWTGPYPAFVPDEGFWGGNNFWAAECHAYRDKYYLFATIRGKADSLLGTAIFEADTPRGPYREHSKGRVTPEGWNSLDGTLHVDRQGRPWMVFCHEWTQIGNGTVEAVRLKKDLSGPAGKPVTLFKASEAPWVRPIRFPVLRNGDISPFGQKTHRIRVGEIFDLHDEADDAAALFTTKAVIILPIRKHMEGGGLFVMKGAATPIAPAFGLQGHIAAYHVQNIISCGQLVQKALGKRHKPSSFPGCCTGLCNKNLISYTRRN